MSGVIYRVEVTHHRSEPLVHQVRSSGSQWFVDLDDLPDHGPLARFEARDHFGDPKRSIRANVDAFLAEHGIDLLGGRITMLCNARSAGYVFNPLTLFWCHRPDGELECVIAEVHNTYGGRYPYLLRPDDAGRAETEKRFYVSPFYPVDGYYRMSVPEPDERLAVTITLHRPGQRPFVASVRGTRTPGGRRGALAAATRNPVATWAVRAAITRHGVALYLKGLPIQMRPDQKQSRAVAPRLAALVRDVSGAELPIRIRAWDGSTAGPDGGPVLVIRNRRALRRLVWSPGELGLSRAYVTGDIDLDGDVLDALRRVWATARHRPTTVPRVSAADRFRLLGRAVRLGAIGTPPKPPVSEARLTGRLHTRSRDRAAIAHHYDLSNEFYELLLDETMAYSSAMYTDPAQALADAQRAKLDLVCGKLGLQPGMRLLDVGCGWGSLILHAAEKYGAHATGVTLSAQQRDFVAKRIADRGLGDLVTVRLLDYRDLGGETFDAVSSIEMGEHVGETSYPGYLQTMFSALRPGGRLVLQQMSRQQGSHAGGGAFIESYIAPDMHMRPVSATVAHLESAGFELLGVEAMREHYVRTVEAWIRTFDERYDEFVALVGEEVARVWRLYLAGGGLAFEEGRMGVDQFLCVRPGLSSSG